MDARILPDGLVEQFLAEARDDLVGLWEIAREVEGEADAGRNTCEDTLAGVQELLVRGMQAGDPPHSAGAYRPWPDQDPDHVIARIQREWLALGRAPNIPDIVWFSLNPKWT
jgi:hypothetical protein